jgi:hypothetical protein
MKKKKTTTPEPKPKYSLGQKLFTITYHKGKPENIFEVKVQRRTKIEQRHEFMTGENKNKIFVSFDYFCSTPDGSRTYFEAELIPSFQQAANKFAEAFFVHRPL